MDIANLLKELETKKLTKTKIIVGRLDIKVIEFLKARDIKIHTNEIYLTSKGLSHLIRDSKRKRGAGLIRDDVLKIPQILEEPLSVYFDSKKDKLNLLYIDKTSKND